MRRPAGYKPYIQVLCLTAYICLVAFGAWHHEPFSDETDAWVVARDTSLDDFLRHFGYAGHPPLWYLILLPFARLGLPVQTMAIINAVLAFAVAWLVLYRVKLPLLLRILFLFTAYMAYQYSVVQRGYMLMILLAFLATVIYPVRLQKPGLYAIILALLANTEVFAMAPAGMLMTEFTFSALRQNLRAYLPAIAIMLTGVAVTVIALWPPADLRFLFANPVYYANAFPDQLRTGFLSAITAKDWALKAGLAGPVTLILLYLPFITLCAVAMAVSPGRWIIFLAAWLGAFYYIFTYKYNGRHWHGMLLPVFAFWTLWLSEVSGIHSSRFFTRIMKLHAYVWLSFCFLLSVYVTVLWHTRDYRGTYAAGKNTAEFIERQGYDDYLIASLVRNHMTELSAYLPHTAFWNLHQGRIANYITWDRTLEQRQQRPLRLWLADIRKKAAHYPTLILTNNPIKAPYKHGLRQIYSAKGYIHSFWLYEFENIDLHFTD